jgi:hypothetical protein
MDEDEAVGTCVNGICNEVKAARGKTKGVLRNIFASLTPILVRSPDPRAKALGLALAAGSAIFLTEAKKK